MSFYREYLYFSLFLVPRLYTQILQFIDTRQHILFLIYNKKHCYTVYFTVSFIYRFLYSVETQMLVS